MDSKSATKSRIPISKSKKEQTSDDSTPKLDEEEPSKTLEMKSALKPKSARGEKMAKTKTTTEVQKSKRNVEKTTLSGKGACTLKNLKPKPQNKNVPPKNIETLSKGMVNLMKTSKTQEIKTSCKPEFATRRRGVSLFSKHTDGASNSHITNAKDEKKDPRKSIAVPKRTAVANPIFKVSPLRRRSRTELEFNLGKAGSSSTCPSLNIVSNKKEHNGNQDKEVVKNSALSRNETCSALEKDVLPKETTQSDSIKRLVRSGSISVPKRPPLERAATKTSKFQSKPLRRSISCQLFDLVLETTSAFGTPDSESQQKNVLDVKAEVTPIRKVPHGGIFFKTHGAKRVPATVFNTQSGK